MIKIVQTTIASLRNSNPLSLVYAGYLLVLPPALIKVPVMKGDFLVTPIGSVKKLTPYHTLQENTSVPTGAGFCQASV